MWNITPFKTGSSKTELKVRSIIREITSSYSWTTTAAELKSVFDSLIKEIPKENAFDPELMYDLVPTALRTAELWKLSATGDRRHKILQVDFIKAH